MEREIVMFFVIDAALLLVPLFIWHKRMRQKLSKASLINAFKALGIRWRDTGEIIKNAVILFLTLLIASVFLTTLFHYLGIDDSALVMKRITGLTPVILIYLILVRSSVEEIFFRGFLVNEIGVLFSSVLFSLAHIGYGSVSEVIGSFVLGLILAWNFKKNKNLIPNIIAHVFYNLILCLILYIKYM
jgi:hypothetical protein